MATPKGMAPAYATSAMTSKMMEDPAKQKMLRDATAGRDNRAVSNESQIMGQMMAGESKRLMEMDKVGRSLAMRKDELDFARKEHEFKKERFGTTLTQRQQELAQKDKQFYDRLDVARAGSENKYEGMEMGLGLLSTGMTIYGGYKSRKQHEKEMFQMRQLVVKHAGISYDYSHESEDDEGIPTQFNEHLYWNREKK